MSSSLNSAFVLLVLPFCPSGMEQRCRPRREGSTVDMRCGSRWQRQRATRLVNKHFLKRPVEGAAAAVEKGVFGSSRKIYRQVNCRTLF